MQKIIKVAAMHNWRKGSDYSVLVCPYFQYPQNNSQIYMEALDYNVSLFSWEYLYIMLKAGVKESESINISRVWNQSEIIGKTTTIENAKTSFLPTQNLNLAKILGLSPDEFYSYFNQVRKILIARGSTEIQYYEKEIERVKLLDRETAITELLKSMKLDSKIATIKGFIDQISKNQTDND